MGEYTYQCRRCKEDLLYVYGTGICEECREKIDYYDDPYFYDDE